MRNGLSDPPDLKRRLNAALAFVAIIAIMILVGSVSPVVLSALSDGPDPTDMRYPISPKDERAIRDGGAIVVLPPIRLTREGKNDALIFKPREIVDDPEPVNACEDEHACETAVDGDCEATGNGRIRNPATAENLIPLWCWGECSQNCNSNGCPQVFRSCPNEPEPDPDPQGVDL